MDACTGSHREPVCGMPVCGLASSTESTEGPACWVAFVPSSKTSSSSCSTGLISEDIVIIKPAVKSLHLQTSGPSVLSSEGAPPA